ncbi:hypothetical protein [Streptomyces sp. NPDC086182]|jgi:hypothetical protein|uniref:hypothetical protein n=1 Tax=Streptomyces sp. NPDC086182 TaxID=3155058 RepID=UPI003417E377
MSTGGDADGIRQAAVPGPRGAELPLPPAAVPGAPHDGDITDGLTETYWSVYDGAASKASTTALRKAAREHEPGHGPWPGAVIGSPASGCTPPAQHLLPALQRPR